VSDNLAETITTARLLLRRFRAEDAVSVASLAGEYDVSRMCGLVPHPYPEIAADGWIMLQAHAWRLRRSFSFAVTLRATGELIGSTGVFRARDAGDAWEIGYWFGRPWWGKGYASESAGAAMDWAVRELGVERIVAGHFSDNPASGAVLRKLGFVYTHSAQIFGMARGGNAPAERFVWPAEAPAGIREERPPSDACA
jgi:[ribosomal protein S5]-alanine N-acetyltransferase